MKSFLCIMTATALIACGGHKKDKSSEPVLVVDPVPTKPLWAGNCDVDYSVFHIEKIIEHKIVLDDRGMDEPFRIVRLNEINSLPDVFLKMMGEAKVPYKMANGGISNFEELSNQKGKPLDDSNPSFTWDDLAGVTSPQGVFLGTTRSGSRSVSIHEGGHVIDALVNLTTTSESLKKLYEFYSNMTLPSDKSAAYRMSNKYEFFATSFDDFYCNAESRRTLRNLYPDLFNYFSFEMLQEISSLPIQVIFDSQK